MKSLTPSLTHHLSAITSFAVWATVCLMCQGCAYINTLSFIKDSYVQDDIERYVTLDIGCSAKEAVSVRLPILLYLEYAKEQQMRLTVSGKARTTDVDSFSITNLNIVFPSGSMSMDQLHPTPSSKDAMQFSAEPIRGHDGDSIRYSKGRQFIVRHADIVPGTQFAVICEGETYPNRKPYKIRRSFQISPLKETHFGSWPD